MKHSPYGLLAVALTFLAAPVRAATDPDVDPAQPMHVAAEAAEGAALVVSDAQLFLQKTAEGTPYLRVDYSLTNVGPDPVYKHAWTLAAGELEATAVAAGTLAPGESRRFSQLVFGTRVASVDPRTVGTLVAAGGDGPLCGTLRAVNTREACEAFAAGTQELCVGTCIAQGASGGNVVCTSHVYEDRNGVKCEIWTPVCRCTGRPAERTFTEALLEGWIDPGDPVLAPLSKDPPLVETRQRY